MAAIVVVFLAVAGKGGENQPSLAGELDAGHYSFDFGTVSMQNGDVSHRFGVKNDEEGSVTISKVESSCMCTQALIYYGDNKRGPFGMAGHGITRTNIEIGAGESAEVEVIFDPTAHGPSGVGYTERVVYIETNSPKTPKVALTITANVVR